MKLNAALSLCSMSLLFSVIESTAGNLNTPADVSTVGSSRVSSTMGQAVDEHRSSVDRIIDSNFLFELVERKAKELLL